MLKSDLATQFAKRLRDALLSAGFNSPRSTSGVSIHKLAEITGYSVQICRKYLRGEAIPEANKLAEIAEKLKVSPGWLLFGCTGEEKNPENEEIKINKNVLHYIFIKASHLYNMEDLQHEVPNFLLELIKDLTLINANEEQSKKIIDLAIASVRHFSS